MMIHVVVEVVFGDVGAMDVVVTVGPCQQCASVVIVTYSVVWLLHSVYFVVVEHRSSSLSLCLLQNYSWRWYYGELVRFEACS